MAYRFLGREPIQARQAQQVKKIFIRRRKNYVQQVPPRWEMPCGENQEGGGGRRGECHTVGKRSLQKMKLEKL